MIEKIELDNFKCFEHLELPLSNLNLLSGINSMGKSTVIQALLLLRQAFEKHSLRDGFYLNGEYVQIGTGQDLLYRKADGDVKIILETSSTEKFCWTLKYKREADYLHLIRGHSDALDKEAERRLNVLNDNFEYVMAERLGPRKSYEKSYYDAAVRNRVGIRGEHAAYYLQLHGEEPVGADEVILGKEGNPPKSLKVQTELWMNQITPGIRLEVSDVQSADVVSMSVRQEENAATIMGTIEEYKPVNVGFGISYSLPVIISLLKARQGDMVILENPEAHLHPSGQRKIGELIARAAQGGAQLIVETHSDHILNGIRLAVKQKILNKEKVKLYYFCLKEEGGVKCHSYEEPRIDDNGRLNFWPEGFFDEWDKVLLDLL